jgi:hypothetical protein
MKRIALLFVFCVILGPIPTSARAELRWETAVESVNAVIEPADAKPGQTVTYKLIVKLNPGFHTYPVVQPDSQVSSHNTIVLPDTGELIFVEPVSDPAGYEVVPTPMIGNVAEYRGGATWEFKAVVSPRATPGSKDIPLKTVKILVCDEMNCLPPRKVDPSAKFKVFGSPVAVEDKYRAAVEKALGTEPPSPSPPRVGPKDVEPSGPPSPKAVGPGKGPDVQPVEAGPPAPEVETAKAGGRRIAVNQDHAADLAAIAEQLPKLVEQLPKSDDTFSGFWTFVATAALWGLVTLLTPCVFPMVPITVSIFVKQSEKQGTNVLALALVYAVTIVVLLSVAAMTLLTTFKTLAVHPVTNVLLGALFVVLSLSLFGLFEITLPHAAVTAAPFSWPPRSPSSASLAWPRSSAGSPGWPRRATSTHWNWPPGQSRSPPPSPPRSSSWPCSRASLRNCPRAVTG